MIKLKQMLLELSLKDMLSKTPTEYIDRALDIRAKLKTIKKGRFYYQTETISNGHIHKQWIKPRPGKFRMKDLSDNVILFCDCGNFTYENEWLLWKKNSSNIINSNGQPLKFRNPFKISKLCKHLVVIVKDLKMKLNKIRGDNV